MEDNTKRRASLGRGLSALFGEATFGETGEEATPTEGARNPKTVPIEFVHPGRFQPRRHFDEEAIQSLVASVRERGILQPLLVRRHPKEPTHYELIAGERRWRAAQLAGLHDVPVVVREFTDREALEIALVENIQRQDLTPLEEAEGYRRLMEEFGHTQDNLAKALGKSRSHIANMLRLLSLPEPVKDMVEAGQLTAGHARALLNTPDAVALARQVAEKGMSVRQAEQLAREAQKPKESAVAAAGRAVARAADTAKDPDTLALEQELSNRLGLKVRIAPQGAGGTLSITYQNLDQLDDVLHRLTGGTASF